MANDRDQEADDAGSVTDIGAILRLAEQNEDRRTNYATNAGEPHRDAAVPAADPDDGDDEMLAPDDAPDAAEEEIDFPRLDAVVPGPRKPRIALMGEFSAGKSTLSNLLIGSSPLPMRVTATQLPPVWIAWGDGPEYREDVEGSTHRVDIDAIGEIDPAETRVIRIFRKSDILEMCDIIDMPGISDPNMSSDVWERVIDHADAVIWCTHATQAWRQSESAVWESLGEDLRSKSLLLLTRFDKILNDQDKRRVMKRVERETEGLFAARLPISLTGAMAAGDDRDRWVESGAEAFTERFVDLIHQLSADLGTKTDTPAARPRRERPTSVLRFYEPSGPSDVTTAVMPSRVVPMRVRPTSARQPAPRPDQGAS